MLAIDCAGMHLKAGLARECVHTLVGVVRAKFCHCWVVVHWLLSLNFEYDKAFRLSFVSKGVMSVYKGVMQEGNDVHYFK